MLRKDDKRIEADKRVAGEFRRLGWALVVTLKLARSVNTRCVYITAGHVVHKATPAPHVNTPHSCTGKRQAPSPYYTPLCRSINVV
jgi:hypothetical protein